MRLCEGRLDKVYRYGSAKMRHFFDTGNQLRSRSKQIF